MLETRPTCVRLERAYLCLDCEHIQDDAVTCSNCGSAAVANVARFLNRESLVDLRNRPSTIPMEAQK